MRPESLSKSPLISAILLLRRLFNLKADTDRIGTVELIKANAEFQSANAWTLVFAILIASVGLNVNSTAVIIGAMLISPLMGPIVGVGLALGTYDFELLKKCARNLAAAVFISIMASTLYFLISPLSEVQSELLARTRPSFFDVLIAFFGGAAGIVAISRKEKGNAIPGVAIATALMPPLCTAGFGLATQNFSYFFGAIYLFVINSVFISISTFVFIRYLGFHNPDGIEKNHQRAINQWIAYVGLVVLIPSFFMAWYLQQESFFTSQANKYINQVLQSDKHFVVTKEISYSFRDPTIKVTLLGETIPADDLNTLINQARLFSISPETIKIKQSSFSENLDKKIGEKMSAAEEFSRQIQIQLKYSEAELNDLKESIILSQKVTDEATTVFPKKLSRVIVLKQNKSISNEDNSDSSGAGSLEMSVIVQWKNTPTKSEIKMALDFLSKRVGIDRRQISNVREL
jgi:uncharacterized hydrophobic protein (TIGR00271 family)